jgi:hypothetical protein
MVSCSFFSDTEWLSYGVEHNKWEPEANCANCPEKVSEYWSALQSQSGMQLVPANAQRKKQRKNKRTSHAAALPAAAVATRSKRRRT